jgi:hypothetical protein
MLPLPTRLSRDAIIIGIPAVALLAFFLIETTDYWWAALVVPVVFTRIVTGKLPGSPEAWLWLFLGAVMFNFSYRAYHAWEVTGVVAYRKGGIYISGPGAISLLVSHFVLSIVCLLVGVVSWHKKDQRDNQDKT